MTDVEDILKRISAHKGVVGTIIMDCDAIPVRTTLDNSTTVQYCQLYMPLIRKARGCVRDIDPQNDLAFLRLRTKKHEIMIAPEKDYLFIVIQNPSEA
ncbi:dynein light chain roadblock-type 2-like [Strongylocentrotus purpuratus]|uniref:Dynein light chain roadblock n=1 Tax=Strongylocentrotus purpuratus TaxID=7668 RepID=A0A7M7N7Q1_STRPU|nr:dynein light chain roadblock-type 2-like [Strongylocentrotus purpuratus]